MIFVIKVNYLITPFISFETGGVFPISFPGGYIISYPANIFKFFYTVLGSLITLKYF